MSKSRATRFFGQPLQPIVRIVSGASAALIGVVAVACFDPALAAVEGKAPPAALSVAQILEKHVAARGGLTAWRAVQTLTVAGKLEAGADDSVARSMKLAREGAGASVRHPGRTAGTGDAAKGAGQVQLPFRLEMKRPHKSRLEIDFAGKTAVQVYDGVNGWKLRPFLNRDDVEPFTEDEAKTQASTSDLEGPLLDSAANGTQVALEGTEPVEGRSAYKLKLTLKNGDLQHIWIDAQSFLDVKVEGQPRRLDGTLRKVWITQRDFRSVQGVMVPYVYETSVESDPHTHRMLVESVTVNRVLDDARFVKPQVLVAGSAPPAPAAQPAPGKN